MGVGNSLGADLDAGSASVSAPVGVPQSAYFVYGLIGLKHSGSLDADHTLGGLVVGVVSALERGRQLVLEDGAVLREGGLVNASVNHDGL